MRLDSLYVKEFKNLRDLTVDFDEGSPFTVLVGRNGTGKSNLLEALVLIFRNLDLQIPPPFDYAIQYECRGLIVKAEVENGETRFFAGPMANSLESLTRSEFFSRDENGRWRYLPSYVFGYYSGPGNRLEVHFARHLKKYYERVRKTEGAAEIRPLMYARPVHSQFTLLAFFSGLGQPQTEFLREYLGIEALESVLFVLNRPSWGTRKPYTNYGWFWEASGVVRNFLDRLYAASLAPLRINSVSVALGHANSEKRDHVFCFLPDVQALRDLAASYESQQAFFSALESTWISDLVREVRVKARIRKAGQALSFRELSEGEQQLLMVLGLLKFTRCEESLFLLDEPDTHLNPAWSAEYLDLLAKVVGPGQESHFVIATHDPLVIAGRVRSEVQILDKHSDGRITADPPRDDPRGMGVSALLTSEIYGLRSELDPHTLALLDRKRELSLADDLSSEERAELGKINSELEGLDFSDSDRDPAYSEWAKLYSAVEKQLGIRGVSMSAEQTEQLKKRLLKIRDELAESDVE